MNRSKKRMLKPNACLIAMLLLSGCASHYDALSTVQWPDRWAESHQASNNNSNATSLTHEWWKAFKEPQLDLMVDQALAVNNNLKVAVFRLRQAELDASLANNSRLPSLSFSAGTNRGRNLGRADKLAVSYSSSLGISYELDLWGKLAKAHTAKIWESQATEQDVAAARQTVAANVARLYAQLGYQNQRLALAKASLAYAEKTLQLVEVQRQAGAVSDLELFSAQRNVSSQQTNLTDVETQLQVARHAWGILFDRPPSDHVEQEPQRFVFNNLPEIDVGLPSDILANRPDVAAAELRLRGSLANVDIARKSFYPVISLTANLTNGSTNLSKLLHDPAGALALNLVLPFINWRENQLRLRVSQSVYDQNVVQFRQTLYTAMSEVEDGLVKKKQDEVKKQQMVEQVRLAEKAESLYEIRYRAGAASLKEWIDAQETSCKIALTNRPHSHEETSLIRIVRRNVRATNHTS